MVIWECTVRGKTSDMELVGKQTSDFLISDVHFTESSNGELQCLDEL